jgi:hypothetical protein
METVKLTQGQVDHLARGIVRMQQEIAAWFAQPGIQEEYERWLAAREAAKKEQATA